MFLRNVNYEEERLRRAVNDDTFKYVFYAVIACAALPIFSGKFNLFPIFEAIVLYQLINAMATAELTKSVNYMRIIFKVKTILGIVGMSLFAVGLIAVLITSAIVPAFLISILSSIVIIPGWLLGVVGAVTTVKTVLAFFISGIAGVVEVVAVIMLYKFIVELQSALEGNPVNLVKAENLTAILLVPICIALFNSIGALLSKNIVGAVTSACEAYAYYGMRRVISDYYVNEIV